MREEEAKTKWCPHVRLAQVENGEVRGFFNRWFGRYNSSEFSPTKEVCNCITSDCMMWAWDNTAVENPKTNKYEALPDNAKTGHCGLINR